MLERGTDTGAGGLNTSMGICANISRGDVCSGCRVGVPWEAIGGGGRGSLHHVE